MTKNLTPERLLEAMEHYRVCDNYPHRLEWEKEIHKRMEETIAELQKEQESRREETRHAQLYPEMLAVMKAACPKCGLNREAAWDNYQAGDGTAKYLLTGCSDCWAWWKERIESEVRGLVLEISEGEKRRLKMTNSIPTIQTAMKGITELLSQDLYGQLSPRDVGVSKLLASIQGILEALYEEGVKYGREMS